MSSLRSVAQCIGLATDFSVLHHFFGLRSVPAVKQLSVRQQMDRLKHRHFHFNVILVGRDGFTSSELDDVNRAVFETREIYSKAGVGVGRVLWFAIPVSMANGHEVISSDDEAEELTSSWTVHNNGLDVFVIRNGWIEGDEDHVGLSDQGASCEKDAGGMSGSVVSVDGVVTGVTMAHEIGHDLGLEHIVEFDEIDEATSEQSKNLMFPINDLMGKELLSWQVAVILQHCLIRPPC